MKLAFGSAQIDKNTELDEIFKSIRLKEAKIKEYRRKTRNYRFCEYYEVELIPKEGEVYCNEVLLGNTISYETRETKKNIENHFTVSGNQRKKTS